MEKQEFWAQYAGHLNAMQQRAVQSVQGPVLLLAVPGSGKTTVLVHRLGYMLLCENICPANILTLTYTVAATRDMADRFATVFGEELGSALEFRTINGICAKIIQQAARKAGKPAFELVTDEKDTGRILSQILAENLTEYPTESDIKNARTLLTYCKNRTLTDEEIKNLGKEQKLPLLNIVNEYNRVLRQNRQMDYDDQMIYAYRILQKDPVMLKQYREQYRYICVDEAQDTSKIQHDIIALLAGDAGNLFMVGDEDQSIYGFRAAYPEALLNFEKDHPGAQVLVMDKNYRSNGLIVEAADRFIQHNRDRHQKHMEATRENGSAIHMIDLNYRSSQYGLLLKEAQDCQRETAVLYRDNENALPLVDLLERQEIAYRMKSVDMTFFTHRVVVDVKNILRFAANPTDADLFMKLYFKCQTYLKRQQAEQLCRISLQKGVPILDAVSYLSDISGMVEGKCRGLRTNLRSMLTESPGKALFRIENLMGYGEYLEKNGLDSNKLFTLKMLANNEKSIFRFLERLDELQELLKNKRNDRNCKFVLSTIHSSKGLEYDRVYLMDVCDGVFPSSVPVSFTLASKEEKKLLEEERRLFYVGMTRAKNELNIFRFKDEPSSFLREMGTVPVKPAAAVGQKGNKTGEDLSHMVGKRVLQKKYGRGVVTGVQAGKAGTADFSVSFDSGEHKVFLYPLAFETGMAFE